MSTYISLLKYTSQGMTNWKEVPSRLDAVRKLYQSMGAELKSYHLTMGRYDAVVVSEAPDDATIARLVLTVSGQGNLSAETLRAFDETELKQIVAGLP